MENNIQNEIKNLATEIDVKLEKLNGQIKTNGEGSADLKNELKNMGEKSAALQEKLEKLETKLSRPNMNGADGKFNFRKALKAVLETDEYKSSIQSKRPFDVIDRIKADMDRGTSYGSEVLESFYQPGVVFDPDRPVHIRQIMSTGSLNSYNLRFRQETAYNDGSSTVAESALKPQSDFTIGIVNRPVEKIAAHMRVSDEMLADANFVSSYISARLPKKILVEEDAQVLYGSGVSPNLFGLAIEAAPYVTLGLTDATKTRYDVLRWAIKNVNMYHYQADAIVLNPEDYALLEMTKDVNENYVLPTMLLGGKPSISGVPIIQNTAVAVDDFFVGNFSIGAQLFEREGLSVRFFDQDQDNAIKNLVTIVAEERVVSAVYLKNSFQYGNFTAALAADGLS